MILAFYLVGFNFIVTKVSAGYLDHFVRSWRSVINSYCSFGVLAVNCSLLKDASPFWTRHFDLCWI